MGLGDIQKFMAAGASKVFVVDFLLNFYTTNKSSLSLKKKREAGQLGI